MVAGGAGALVGATVGAAVGAATVGVGVAVVVAVVIAVVAALVVAGAFDAFVESFVPFVDPVFEVPSAARVESVDELDDGVAPPSGAFDVADERAVDVTVEVAEAASMTVVDDDSSSTDSTAVGDRSSPPHATPTSDATTTRARESPTGRAGRCITCRDYGASSLTVSFANNRSD